MSRNYVNQHSQNDPYRRKEDPYARNINPYRRNDDPYRRSDDPYRRNDDPYRRNEPTGRSFTEDPYYRKPQDVYGDRKPTGDGFHTDSYKSSGDMDGYHAFGRPDPAVYEVDHLVTFDVSPKLGVRNHKDGMERLKHMELTSGIWTMRHILSIDDREIVITEKATRKELESFPISRVIDPVNITSSDLQEIYNNIIIFIVQNESSKNAAEMHIFQCIGKPGQDLIDDIEAARVGKFPRPTKEKRRSVSSQDSDKRHSVPYDDNRIPANGQSRNPLYAQAVRANSVVLPEDLEADIVLLNRCFDNIESFVASLQQAANAQKKLEQVKSGGAIEPNEFNYLTDKARPPPAREFVDTFQKFKLALNLLPRLKNTVKDPNAQELTHLLFSPLALVVEASREPDGQPKLAMSVTSPLLNRDTCILLDSSLHAEEIELWRSLKDSWNVPADMWTGPVPPPYVPRFADNSKPARLQSNASSGSSLDKNQGNGIMPNGAKAAGTVPNSARPTTPVPSVAISSKQDDYLRALKAKNSKVCKVSQNRPGKNPKELSVSAGEYVEVLEDSKKWWKVSNISNESGFVPSTILIII